MSHQNLRYCTSTGRGSDLHIYLSSATALLRRAIAQQSQGGDIYHLCGTIETLRGVKLVGVGRWREIAAAELIDQLLGGNMAVPAHMTINHASEMNIGKERTYVVNKS